MYKIGQGIDFHLLETNPERPFLLGGYSLDTDLSLVGHSDADILLHAIADAILGAMALGDIGDHFPDTDPNLKNMDSKRIIEKCLKLLNEGGYTLVNLDCTIIGEQPKISPHRLGIRQNLSLILNLPQDCISLKATTTEKMGAIGRKEGIAALAICLITKH
jgi:2-C-methyl-D-erythritol 2,4-cyclodiphosphate synthase